MPKATLAIALFFVALPASAAIPLAPALLSTHAPAPVQRLVPVTATVPPLDTPAPAVELPNDLVLHIAPIVISATPPARIAPPPPPKAATPAAELECSRWQPLVQGGHGVEICAPAASTEPRPNVSANGGKYVRMRPVQSARAPGPRPSGSMVFVNP